MGKRCVFATIATIVAVAIALGVGLGLGLKSDDAAAGVFVFGETELTGFSSSEFNGNPNNALNFRRGVASLSSTVEYNDVTITSVTDVARRRAALRKILAVSSRVKIAFNVAVSDATEQTSVKTTYQAVTPTQLKTALTGQGLSVTAATAPTVTVTAPAPAPSAPAAVSSLSAAARSSAIAAALNPTPISVIPAAGITTAASGASRVDGRSLAAVTPAIDVDSCSAESAYATAAPPTTYVRDITSEIFQTPTMIVCFMSNVGWFKNLNSGAYIAEIDASFCENQYKKGELIYSWVVNATGANVTDTSDTRDFKINVWVAMPQEDGSMMNVDTEMKVLYSDIAINGDRVNIKKSIFTYQMPKIDDGNGGMVSPMVGFVERSCDITADADAVCTKNATVWYELSYDGSSQFEAATRSETETGGVTKAKFKYNDEGVAQEGKVFAQDGKAKLSLGSTDYCDNIASRKYGSDRYTLYDDTCALVSRTSSSALKATVSGTEYIAWVMYGGGVDLPTMNWMVDPPVAYTPTELAAAKAAFVDGKPVEMIVDWSDSSQNVAKTLRAGSGVLYKVSPVVVAVSAYPDIKVTVNVYPSSGGFYSIEVVYRSNESMFKTVSKSTDSSFAERAFDFAADLGSEPASFWGPVTGSGTLLNATHVKLSKTTVVNPTTTASTLTLTCASGCADPSKFGTLGESDDTSNYQFATPIWSSTYSQYKTYTFDKQTSILTSGSTPVMYDNVGSSTTFKWNQNAIHMELFEATEANRAALSCATDVSCEYIGSLDEYYVYESGPWSKMVWFENPSDSADTLFLQPEITLVGQITSTHAATSSGTNYVGKDLSLYYNTGYMHGLPFRCFNSATGVVTDAVVNVQYGYAYCEVVGDSYPWHMPDVVIPDGTTFKDPLDDKKYTVRTTEAIETLERLDNSQCGALDLDEVSLDYPTSSGYVEFTMPTKPSMSTLTVGSVKR
uniref:Uncharacterized protein n=1 Tax=Ostreococcus sp. 'lucimarinus' TaxID=242159 RepID=A0A7R9XQW0_9CHLO